MSNSRRILFLDYARVLTAFLVVYAHIYSVTSQVRLYIYAFHMPLFFIISGFLHSPRTTNKELIKYFRILFIPILFFILYGVIVSLVFFNGNIINFTSKIIENVSLHGDVPGNGTVWFLFALLNIKLMMFFYLKVFEKRTIYVRLLFFFIVFGFFFGIRLLFGPPINPFFLKQSFMAFPLYFIGYNARKLYDKKSLRIPDNYSNLLIALVLLVLCVLITKVNGRVSMIGFSFGHSVFPLNILLFYTNGIVGSLMIICISLVFKRENKIITLTANSLISILGFQVPLMCVFHYFETGGNYLVSAMVSIFVIMICVILNQIIMKICPELLGKKR